MAFPGVCCSLFLRSLSFENEISRDPRTVLVGAEVDGLPSSESLEVLLVRPGCALEVDAVADIGEIGSENTTVGDPVGTTIDTAGGFGGGAVGFGEISSDTFAEGGITTGVPGILVLWSASLASLIFVTH